jgi:hypothetical protein
LISAVFVVPPSSTSVRRRHVADEEGAVRRHELGVVDRGLVATAVAQDIFVLHLLDQRLGVRITDRDLTQVESA